MAKSRSLLSEAHAASGLARGWGAQEQRRGLPRSAPRGIAMDRRPGAARSEDPDAARALCRRRGDRQRQGEREGASVSAAGALDPDFSAVRDHDLLANREAETLPSDCVGCPADAIETIEHPGKIVGRDAEPLIGDAHHPVTALDG